MASSMAIAGYSGSSANPPFGLRRWKVLKKAEFAHEGAEIADLLGDGPAKALIVGRRRPLVAICDRRLEAEQADVRLRQDALRVSRKEKRARAGPGFRFAFPRNGADLRTSNAETQLASLRENSVALLDRRTNLQRTGNNSSPC